MLGMLYAIFSEMLGKQPNSGNSHILKGFGCNFHKHGICCLSLINKDVV